MRLPRKGDPRVRSHETRWSPRTERLHTLAQAKLASSRDISSVSQRDLDEPQGSVTQIR